MKSHRLPLLPVMIAVITGILSGKILSDYTWLSPAIEILFAVTVLFLLYFRKLYAAILGGASFLGLIAFNIASPSFPESCYEKKDTVFKGIIKDETETSSGKKYTIELLSLRTGNEVYKIRNSKVNLYINKFESFPEAFDEIIVEAPILPLKYEPQLPGDPDYTRGLLNRGFIGNVFAGESSIKVTDKIKSIESFFFRSKKKCGRLLDECGVTSRCANFLKAILLGESKELTPADRVIYTNAGLAHILALSGMHIAIIGGFVFILLMPLRAFGFRNAVFLLTLLSLWCYAFLTGLSASVVRSVIMISVVYLASMTGRRANSLNSLFLAAIIILVFSPTSLFSLSFQLSFASVAAILFFGELLRKKVLKSALLDNILKSLLISVITLGATAMITAYYFNQLPVYSILSNFPGSLLLPVIIIGGVIILVGGAIGIDLYYLSGLLDFLHGKLLDCCQFFSDLPNAVIDNIYPEAIIFLPYCAALVLLYLAISRKKKVYAFAMFATLAMCIPFFDYPVEQNGNGLYIYGNSRDTEIIACNSNDVVHLSTRYTSSSDEKLRRLKNDHKRFLGAHGTDRFVSISQNVNDKISYSKNILRIDDIVAGMVLNNDDIISVCEEPFLHFCIVATPFIEELFQHLVDNCEIDTVILPRELHVNHLEPFKNFFKRHGIKVISLREEKFWLSL